MLIKRNALKFRGQIDCVGIQETVTRQIKTGTVEQKKAAVATKQKISQERMAGKTLRTKIFRTCERRNNMKEVRMQA
jgi:hypothetical protein